MNDTSVRIRTSQTRVRLKSACKVLSLVSIATALACDRAGQTEPTGRNLHPNVRLTVDSILPRGEALKRFQSDLPRVTGFREGAGSRGELLARFVSALEAGDAAALGRLRVSRAEYAFLYFPASAYNQRPYDLPPEIAWFLSEQNSAKGLTRLQRRLGGRPLRFHDYQCGAATIEGANRFWRSCTISYEDPVTRRSVTRELFGAIMERDGRYKFLSYANDF